MRVLILSWRDIKNPWKGGSEVYLHEIARRLVKKGHEVTMFASAHPGGSLPFEVVDGVEVIRKGNMFLVYPWFFWMYLTRFRGKFDIIIDQNNGIPFFSPAIVSSVPVVNLTHHIYHNQWFEQIGWPMNYIGYFLEKYVIPLAYRYTKFVVVSDSTKRDVLKYWGKSENNVLIVSNAVDGDIRKSISKSRFPSLLYLGRLKKYKQIDLIIKSMLRLLYKWPNLTLHVAGGGDQSDYLKDLAERMGIAKSIVFHGYVSDKLKKDLLSEAWAFVTASSHEGWGISVIEANACGTLAIGSNIDGLKDAIVDNETGLLFDSGSIFDLSEKIKTVLSNPGMRYKLEKNALARAKKFTWDKSAKEMERLLYSQINKDSFVSDFKPLKTKSMKNKRSMPLVSVVLPVKNVVDFVEPTLKSVLAQSYPNIEFIVVDNDSKDGSKKLIKKYTKKFFSKKFPERNHQRNFAVSKAKGKYLMFIDSDMVLHEQLVADCVYNLERFKKSIAVILPERQVGDGIWSKARKLEKEFYEGEDGIESPRFFRRAAYLKSGGYDEDLLYAEDMELTERMRKLGNITRSKFVIYHNEERLGWWDIIKKKYGYGKTAKYYFAKSVENNASKTDKKLSVWEKLKMFASNPWVYLSGGNVETGKAVSTTKFVRPVFVKKWRKFLNDPIVSVSFFFLRFTELSAMGIGYLISFVVVDQDVKVNKQGIKSNR